MKIVEFIKARLTEDEQIAQTAAERSPDWWLSEDTASGCVWGGERTPPEPDWGAPEMGEHTIVYDEGYPDRTEAAHIARHDPARVLRQCAALRRVFVEEMDSYVHLEGAGQTFDHEEADESTIFRGLASVWSDHPDYRPEWAQG